MDPLEYAPKNSVALAVLGSILFWILLVAFSNLVFMPSPPEKPGFALPSGAEAPTVAAAPAAPQTPLPVLLAKADAKKRADILAYLQTLSDKPVAFPQ